MSFSFQVLHLATIPPSLPMASGSAATEDHDGLEQYELSEDSEAPVSPVIASQGFIPLPGSLVDSTPTSGDAEDALVRSFFT